MLAPTQLGGLTRQGAAVRLLVNVMADDDDKREIVIKLAEAGVVALPE